MFIYRGKRHPNGRRRKWVNWFRLVVLKLTRRTLEAFFPKRSQSGNGMSNDNSSGADKSEAECEDSDRRTIRRLEYVGHYLLNIYYLGGISICMWTVAMSARYVFSLRDWVKHSGWMSRENGRFTEDDATTFGQLIPMFTSALVAFTFLEMISSKSTIITTSEYLGTGMSLTQFSAAMNQRRLANDLQEQEDRNDMEKPRPEQYNKPLKIQYTTGVMPGSPSTVAGITPSQSQGDEIMPASTLPLQQTPKPTSSYFLAEVQPSNNPKPAELSSEPETIPPIELANERSVQGAQTESLLLIYSHPRQLKNDSSDRIAWGNFPFQLRHCMGSLLISRRPLLGTRKMMASDNGRLIAEWENQHRVTFLFSNEHCIHVASIISTNTRPRFTLILAQHPSIGTGHSVCKASASWNRNNKPRQSSIQSSIRPCF